jgi:polyhydroxybutyrate depolymerase
VDLFEVRGGGHTWPSGEQYLGERLVGRVSRELDANQAIWEFFRRHRRQ